MKKLFCVLLCAVVLLAAFCGCEDRDAASSRESASRAGETSSKKGEPVTLTVMIQEEPIPGELSGWNISVSQKAITNVADYYNATHENVQVEVELLSVDPDKNASQVQSVRVPLMAGQGGPDVLILTNAKYSTGQTDAAGEEVMIEPLIRDVERAMYNGVFTDLSPYYNGDEALNTDDLNAGVMDAGVLDGKRFVLPLGYETDVILAERSAWEASGLGEHAQRGVDDLYAEVLKRRDKNIAYGLDFGSPGAEAFPRLYDYRGDDVLLTGEEVEDLLRQEREISLLSGYRGGYSEEERPLFCNASSYVSEGADYWVTEDYPVWALNYQTWITATAAMGKLNGVNLEIQPLRDTDGNIPATVTCWGAVTSSCEHVAEAYDFLRTFLTPEVQLGRGLEIDGRVFSFHSFVQTNNWPVRKSGAADAVWNVQREGARSDLGEPRADGGCDLERYEGVLDLVLEDGDLPVPRWEFSNVRFSSDVYETFAPYTWRLVNFQTGGPSDVNLAEAAEDVMEHLTWQVLEG